MGNVISLPWTRVRRKAAQDQHWSFRVVRAGKRLLDKPARCTGIDSNGQYRFVAHFLPGKELQQGDMVWLCRDGKLCRGQGSFQAQVQEHFNPSGGPVSVDWPVEFR